MKDGEVDNGGSDNPREVAGADGPLENVPAPPTEIAASIVRSSLAQIEIKASAILTRIEHVTGGVQTGGQSQSAPKPDVQSRSGSIKEPLPSKKSPREVMATLEDFLANLCGDDEQQDGCLPVLDEVSQLAVLQHSTAAYVRTLSRKQLLLLVERVRCETAYWLGKLFKFAMFHTAFYRDDAECTLQVLRIAYLHHQTELRAAVTETGPSGMSIYLSDKSELLPVVENTCRYMGWSQSCIRLVPSEQASDAADGIAGRMNLNALESMIEADLGYDIRPMMVIGTVGSATTGASDDLEKLIAICASHRVWLHCHGYGLAALVLTKHWMTTQPNSMTLSLDAWLGVIGVPSVLVHKSPNDPGWFQGVSTVFDSDPVLSTRISSLSVWSALEVLGADQLAERIFSAFDSCQELCKMLLQFDGIHVVTKPMFYESSESYRKILMQAYDYETLFGQAVPIVLFQFDGHGSSRSHSEQSAEAEEEGEAKEQEERENEEGAAALPAEDVGIRKNRSNAQYYDRLNSWFGQNLVQDAPQLNVTVMEHEVYGTVIRYCPFGTGYAEQLPRTTETLLGIERSLETHIEILRSTVLHRVRFQQLVAESSVLRLVELHDWAGLGVVHYVPEGWESLGTDQAKDYLNKLNQALVEALQATDSAFSQGESSEGLICVKFGMVMSETDVDELLELVIQTARSVQEKSKVFDTMTEILKKGIEAATIDLQREAEEKLRQEGILRQMPLVGRVVNWWAPPSKETGMKGRSLNLTQGVVESTENIYKYHMQMTPQTSNQLPGNKGPPAPLVQKPISPDQRQQQPAQQPPAANQQQVESAQHSRNASSSSELSGRGVATGTTPPVLIKLPTRKPMMPLVQQMQQVQLQQQPPSSPPQQDSQDRVTSSTP
ncbi:pyridoxal-dependent decarboxylase domain-containing protein 1 isoform X2 [Anopheles coustani]|uniref:pyridoxal-dependent decarboxylase domain-containing protein 1 isoform X2 n=1 Tax=Anopheles coustani TaxID=139045 RepID=UPI0026584197|nr:pyridoxal-dependent decarboxylase domain-containing protein 1 isoform X2 [Anopheles coustani]